MKNRIVLTALFTVLLAGIGYSHVLTEVMNSESARLACSAGAIFDCSKNLTSAYGKVVGIPVSALATALFAFLFIHTLVAYRRMKVKGECQGSSSGIFAMPLLFGYAAGLVALYYISISIFVLHAICLYCSVLYGLIALTIGLSYVGLNIPFAAQPALFLNALTALRASIRGQSGFFRGSEFAVRLGSLVLAIACAWLSVSLSHSNPAMQITLAAHSPQSVSITEFGDFECAACKHAALELDELKRDFPGRVAVKFVNYPLCHECNPEVPGQLHPYSCLAAKIGIVMKARGKFDAYCHALFSDTAILNERRICEVISQLGEREDEIRQEANSAGTAEMLRKDIELGRQANVRATPTLIIDGQTYQGGAVLAQVKSALSSGIALASIALSTPQIALADSTPHLSVSPAAFEAGNRSTGNTFYIAANGSDSNTGASKSTPWAHLPGMPTCVGNCAAYTPQPGDHFIFRGGDKWSNADLGIAWVWSATQSAPIYIGVDQTWFAGSSWTRPVWSCDGKVCSNPSGTGNTYFVGCGSQLISYITVDNIEMTGLLARPGDDSSGGFVEFCGTYDTISNCYMHGWSHAGANYDNLAAISFNGGYDVTGGTAYNNVIDGSDTTRDSLVAFFLTVPIAYNNVVRYVSNGFEASGDTWHDNLVEYLVPCFVASGCHQNFMFHFGPYTGKTVYLYNNVLRHATWQNSGGAPKLWLEGLGTCPGCTTYAFNNIIYDQQSGNYLNVADHPAGDYGTFYVFNNTFQVGSDSNIDGISLDQQSGDAGALYSTNNHWISSGIGCTAAGLCTESNDVIQSLQQANAQGYNDTMESFVFSPASSSGATIGAGVNLSSYCSGEAAALCRDATFAVGYNTTNHTVIVPARASRGRPATGAWDAGAYQFGSMVLTITTTSPLPSATAGKAYSQTIAASGGTAPYTWTLSSGTLPAGLNLSASGVLGGTPTAAGTFNFAFKVTDTVQGTATKSFALTVSAPDTQPPSVPTNLAATAVSPTQINLTWSASTDNVGVAGYTIFRGGTKIATSAAATYSNTGLSPDTAYLYTVSAFDAAGNNSAQSNSVSAKTPAGQGWQFVQAGASNPGTASNATAFNVATKAGDLIVVEVDWSNSVSLNSISDSQGNTYTQIGTEQNSAAIGVKSRLYYAKNIKGGSDTVTTVLSGAASVHELYIQEYSGLDPVSPLDGFSVAVSSGASFSSNTATTTSANDLLFGVEIDSATGSAAPGWTMRSNFDSNVVADKSGAASGSYAFTGASSGAYVAWIAAFKPAGSGTNSPPAVTSAANAFPNPAFTGQAIAFNIAASDPDGDTLTYSWNFGDGASGSGLATSHSYSAAGTYTAVATVADGHGNSVTSSVVVTVSASTAIRINSGGAASGSFAADTSFSGGYKYSTTHTINTASVANPAPQAVYQTERYGNFSYTLGGLTSGTAYTVRLHFAEIYWSAPGKRVFNVSINGQQVLTNFDIYAAAGGNFIAIVREFTATADANGRIVVVYTTVKDNAKSSGIEVLTPAFATSAAPAAALEPDSALTSIDLGSTKTKQMVNQQLDAPDTGKLKYTVISKKALPPGISVSAAGKVRGRPKAPGAYTFQIKIQGKQANVVNTYSIFVSP